MFDVPGSPGSCNPQVGKAVLCSSMMWPCLHIMSHDVDKGRRVIEGYSSKGVGGKWMCGTFLCG